MPQFFVPAGSKINDEVTLSPEDSRHVATVFRKGAGDVLLLADGVGGRFRGIILSTDKRGVRVAIQERLPDLSPHGRIIFSPGLLKGDKMEFVLQKAAELGVDTLAPFTSTRTVAEWKSDHKMKRWMKIAEEAAKQCGRATQMQLEEPVPFEKVLTRLHAETKIIFWEESERSLKEAACKGSVAVMVGPEGGFSREEVDLAVKRGFTPLSLGSFILRAETAAIAALSLVQYELGNIRKISS